ncbi:MAG: glycosyltransferase family 4 protein [Bdellovibrionales bacterium]|nr:glycosyltransferase family 4 protein [Bdellovibrionales bacterium]
MKIVFIISSLGTGGAERALSLLASSFANHGDDVSIATFAGRRVTPAYFLHPQIGVHNVDEDLQGKSLLYKVKGVFRVLSKIKSFVKDKAPDVVVTFMDQTNVLSLIALRSEGIPVVVCEQIHPEYSSLVNPRQFFFVRACARLFRNFCYSRASGIVVVARQSKDALPKWLIPKVHVIQNPVARPQLEPTEIRLPPQSIVALGRLEEQKRFDILIRAFALIHEKYPAWELFVFGEGSKREALEKLISDLGLGSVVHLPGITNAPYQVLKQAEIFALSSDFEGFPLSLGEALASGKPVVVTNCPSGPAELVQHGVNGYLCPIGDYRAFASHLEKLVSSTGLVSRMGESAKISVEKYSLERIFYKWRELLISVQGKSSSGRKA